MALAHEIAKRRIEKLMKLAWATGSKRYAEMARALERRIRVRIPLAYKRWICKRCSSPLIPGRTAIVRLKKGVRVVICKNCGAVRRFPYKP